MLDSSCVIVLLLQYLPDMGYHVDMLSMHISKQLVAINIYIITVSQLAKDIIKCGPNINIVIFLSGLVSGRCIYKSVIRTRCSVCMCNRFRNTGSIMLHLIILIISQTTLIILHKYVSRGKMTRL